MKTIKSILLLFTMTAILAIGSVEARKTYDEPKKETISAVEVDAILDNLELHQAEVNYALFQLSSVFDRYTKVECMPWGSNCFRCHQIVCDENEDGTDGPCVTSPWYVVCPFGPNP